MVTDYRKNGLQGFLLNSQVAIATLLTPIGYFGYVIFVRWFQGNPLKIEPIFSEVMILYLFVLALTGVLMGLAWRLELRITQIIASGGLLVYPWMYLSIPIGNVGYVMIPFVGVLIIASLEVVILAPMQLPNFPFAVVESYALAFGILHFILGFALQIATRQLWWVNPTYGLSGILLMGMIYALSGLALVATGVLTIVLWLRQRLVTPLVLILGWFSWGLYGTWTIRRNLPLSEFTAINWTAAKPYPDYMLRWAMLLIIILGFAGAEFVIRSQLERYIDV